MNTYQATGLAQYYAGTIDNKSKPKKNTKKKKCKKPSKQGLHFKFKAVQYKKVSTSNY